MSEAMNHYETVIIISTKVGEDGQKELIERFKSRISRHGTIEEVDEWGKRRLAYPINKETEGYYTLIHFKSTPDFTNELDRRYQITDGILRSIIIKKDPKVMEAAKKRKAAQKTEEPAAKPTNAVDVEAVAAESMNIIKPAADEPVATDTQA